MKAKNVEDGHKTMETLRMIMMVRNMLFKAQNRKEGGK